MSGIPDEAVNIDMLKQIGKIKIFNKNDIVFKMFDEGNGMYLIVTGSVGVYIQTEMGEQIKIDDIGAGGFFGEMSLLERLPRSATIVANELTYAVLIDNDNAEKFIKTQPTIAYRLMKALSSRIRKMDAEIERLKFQLRFNETNQAGYHENDEESLI